MDLNFDSLFDGLCKNLFLLLTSNGNDGSDHDDDNVPFDVTVRFWAMEKESTFEKYYNDIYLSALDKKKVLKDYKPPKLSQKQKKFIKPLISPIISFCYNYTDGIGLLRVTNAEKMVR